MSQDVNERANVLVNLVSDINLFIGSIDSSLFFIKNQPSVNIRHHIEGESSFLKLISWLYILYFENAKNSILFFERNKVIPDLTKNQIRILRTYFQHHLDSKDKEDAYKISYTESWFYENIQKSIPESSTEWFECSKKIIDNAIDNMELIYSYLRTIKDSEFNDLFVSGYKKQVLRSFDTFDYEKVIIKVLQNFDLHYFFDANILTKKYLSFLQAEVNNNMLDTDNFEEFVQICIEKKIILDKLVPVNGNDIKEFLQLDNGVLIKQLLEKAYVIFWQSPCSKQELLQKLKGN